MLLNICIGSLLLFITTMIHAEGMLLALRYINHHIDRWNTQRKRMYHVAIVILLMFLTSLAEIALWAATFIFVNAIEGVEPALYFSAVTYTTLGFGDIVLNDTWRLLAPFEAANGIIMFSWSAAIVVAVVQLIRSKDAS